MSDASSPKGEIGPSSKLKPEDISEAHAEKASVAAGWWAVDSIGTPILGPYPNHETTLLAIAIEKR